MSKFLVYLISVSLLIPYLLLTTSEVVPTKEVAASSLSTVGKGPGPCVKYPMNASFGRANYALRFTNFCPDKVYINVCVTYSDGTSKLYTSGRRVQTAGFMEIYTDPFKSPVDFKVTYGPVDAGVPPPCNLPAVG